MTWGQLINWTVDHNGNLWANLQGGSQALNFGSNLSLGTGTISATTLSATTLIGTTAANLGSITNASNANALLFSGTAPTVSSGFGTNPSITANGTLTFRVNVGTGGTATGGVIGLPTAPNGWNLDISVLNPTATNLLHTTYQSANTTNTVTIANVTTSTGASTAWPASTILMIQATAF